MEMNWLSSSVWGTMSESDGGVLETQGSLPSQCTHNGDSQCSGSLCVASFHWTVILGASGQHLHFPESKGWGTEGPPLTSGRAGGWWQQGHLTLTFYGPSLEGTPGPPSLKGSLPQLSSQRVPCFSSWHLETYSFLVCLFHQDIGPKECLSLDIGPKEPSSAGGIMLTAKNNWI